MIFLKKFQAYGFKSFAKYFAIDFKSNIAGIIGPNGSGKSNIIDAIKWVLGEQSLKSLRGNENNDVIFNGSVDLKPSNFAEVIVTFDNTNRIFNVNFDEVEIKRKIYRSENLNEYFINNEQVRLKDIKLLAAECGITRHSLATISQGQITNFAGMNSQEKRTFFNQAAGLGKYKINKKEAVSKLSKIEENLTKAKIVLQEQRKILKSLESQKSKATKYLENKAVLQDLEIAILTKDIQKWNKQLLKKNSEVKLQNLEKTNLTNLISDLESKYNVLSNSNYQLEQESVSLNIIYQKNIEQIYQLKLTQNELKEKQSKQNSQDQWLEIRDKYYDLQNNLKLNEKFLQDQQKILKEQQDQKFDLQQKIIKYNLIIQKLNNKIFQIESEKEYLVNKSNHFRLPKSISVLLDNQNTLPGILGLVKDVIQIPNEYKLPINIALETVSKNLVINNKSNVVKLIEFLKKNNLGVTTFFPLDNIFPRYISDDVKFILENTSGFVNIAANLVSCEKKYENLAKNLLGQIIIAETYHDSLQISKILRSKFNVISLTGEWIKPFGAIRGGSYRNKLNQNNYEDKLLFLQEQKNNLEVKYKSVLKERNLLEHKVNDFSDSLESIQKLIGQYQYVIENCKTQIFDLKNQYDFLHDEGVDNKDKTLKFNLNDKIFKLKNTQDELKAKISKINNQKLKNIKYIKLHDQQILNNRNKLLQITEELGNYNVSKTKLKNNIQKSLNVLIKSYNLTLKSASKLKHPIFEDEALIREKITKLKYEFSQLKNVNLEAIEEYQTIKAEYDILDSEYQAIWESSRNLIKVIKKLDKKMISIFKNFLENVNKELKLTFQMLFGGGEAKIILENLKDILSSGIIINVNPPGKNINNLRLLSGGEKSLISLAVLFAILKTKLLPLVLLDEAEAALDPSNIVKFAKYLKAFSKNTQFLIITHRLSTMEYCDFLYGATMQVKGVTKMVAIKLTDAKKLLDKSNSKDLTKEKTNEKN